MQPASGSGSEHRETSVSPDMAAFPRSFAWGAATSAYQVEGAVGAGGRGPSIWDAFSHAPGRVRGGDHGDVATDHYHRWEGDVALMAELGLTAYRFSVAWPRIQPDGRGRADARGLDFYGRLVDGLLAHGIVPVATLYHWDLPLALEEGGGWRQRDTAGRFADYALLVAEALADRVGHWTTINEPRVAAFLGHASGEHAPGLTDPAAAVSAAHHLLLAHGLGTQALRAAGAASTGITLDLSPIRAATGAEADAGAARLIDGLHNRLFLDPVLAGEYPADVLVHLDGIGGLDAARAGDLAVIGEGVDVLGVNYYTSHTVRAVARGPAAEGGDTEDAPSRYPGAGGIEFLMPDGERTAMGWGVDPDGLTQILLRLAHDHPGTPLAVHENGAAYDDEPGAGGAVEDTDRLRYLATHVDAAARAVRAGVDLRGYFVWSLLDNFEWAEGYAKRFGIVRVDYATLERTPKASAMWYRDRLAEHRAGW